MDSLSTTSLHEQLGVCKHKVSKPNPLRFSSNLPLIWMACLIRLYYPSVHSNVLTHSASLRYSFPTLLLSPSPATATDKHWESETIQISCKDLFFFSFFFYISSYVLLVIPQFSAPRPTRRSANSYQGAAAYTAQGQRCCTLQVASRRRALWLSSSRDRLQSMRVKYTLTDRAACTNSSVRSQVVDGNNY